MMRKLVSGAQQRTWLMMSLGLVLVMAFGLVIASSVYARPGEQEDPAEILRIGYIGQPGSDMARGLGLAIQQINDTGGVSSGGVTYEYELVIEEIGDNPDDVPIAVQNLTNQDVIVIFGPDSNALALPNAQEISNATVPILTTATSENLLSQDPNGNIFRLVAPESTYSEALANYLASELSLTELVIVQSDIEQTEGVITFNNALANANVNANLILVEDNEQLMTRVRTLPQEDPEAVVFFGPTEDAVAVLSQLRANDWSGLFVYRNALEGLENSELSGELGEGVLSVASWVFGATNPLGERFISQYVRQYGAVPGPHSVAGYDGMFALTTVVRRFGTTAPNIRTGLPQLDTLSLVRGPINPQDTRNLSRTAIIFELTGEGGADALVAYDGGEIREDAGFAPEEGEEVGELQPTATLLPTDTPTSTPQATATPSVLTATVTSRVLNVRTGPGTEYDPPIGQLERGDQVPVIGANADLSWLLIQFRGQSAWISAQFVDIFDPANFLPTLPIVAAPPTPTPGPTNVPPEPDLVITNMTLSVGQTVEPGVAFNATVSFTNQGGSAAGSFTIAANFRPDENNIRSADISSLGAGQSGSVVLGPITLNQTGYVPDQAVIIDFNNSVPESANGETNNIFTFAYKVDEPLHIQTQTTLVAGQSYDFFGGTGDVTWDGNNLNMNNGALIGLVTGSNWVTSHYGQVAGIATNAMYANPSVGNVFAIITAEGDYGYLRVDNRSGGNITFTYRVYNP